MAGGWLFGQDFDELPEYAVQIIVDNPQARADWEGITTQMQAAAMHHNKRTFREIMKRYGFPLAAIGSLYQAAQTVTVGRPIKKPGQLRGMSFWNLTNHGQVASRLVRYHTTGR